MIKNNLRALWQQGKPVLNGWCSIGSGFVAEIMAAQGYDALTVDLQHGALDASDLLAMFQAMRASDVVAMARVPWLEPGAIMKALDLGAYGVICPMIGTAAQAAEFVSYLRYPPLGQRSFGPTRATFAAGANYASEANAEILGFAMIETAEGMANLAAIAATPGLDAIYVGPSDLSLGLSNGRLPPGQDREEPEMIAAIQRIAVVCKAAGIRVGLHCATADYAARAVSWGYDLTTVGGDVRFLAGAAGASVGAFRALMVQDSKPIEAGGY